MSQPRSTTGDESSDLDRAAAVGHRGGVALVLGAPGTGKSTLVVEHVRRRVTEGAAPDACLVLGPTRQAADRLRTQIGQGLGATHADPLARSAASLAFAVLRLAAAREGAALPRLISGAEQDVVLRDLLAGHRENGAGPAWPEHLAAALPTAGFRAQLRDLLMRAVERGLEPEDLRRLARDHSRPEWAGAADVLAEYDQVTALSDPGSYDPAWICTAAADTLEDDDELRRVVHGRLEAVVVDDAQELTASAARLVEAVTPAGADLMLVGDPDAATLGFRGAVPGLFVELAHRMAGRSGAAGATGPHTVLLRRRAGLAPVVGQVADRVAERIEVAGVVGQRRPAAPDDEGGTGQVEVALARSTAQEAAHVARWLRRAHLLHGVPWREMVVLARSGSQQDTIRRALVSGGVPVRVDRSAVPLGQDPAVTPFLLAFDVVTRDPVGEGVSSVGASGWRVGPEEAVELLTGPLGGLDPVGLRRLRRLLRAEELAGAGSLPAGELLARTVTDPELRRSVPSDLSPDLAVLVRLGLLLDAGRAAHEGREGVPGSAEEVLWALWERSGLAGSWGEQALSGGALGARADRDLDAVLVLFGAAESYVERFPGRRARGFLDHVRGAEVAADTLVVGARREEVVDVLTPQASAGRRWGRVAVVGVQEGVWPDLRLRDTLLGAEALVAALEGRPVGGAEAWRAAQVLVRTDELRQFHVAVTRARQELLVTAVSSTEEQPSALLDLVDPAYRERPAVDVPAPLTLRGLVGDLRRTAVRAQRDGDHRARDQAVGALLRLAEEGVPGADPSTWWSVRPVSTARELRSERPVRVSPSQLQTFGDCPLRWFLTSRGAETGDADAAEIGTLVHDVVAAAPGEPVEVLAAELDRRWPDLDVQGGWVGERARVGAHRMLERYATYVAETTAEGRELVGTELPLSILLRPEPTDEGDSVPPRPVRLTGAVDRLERDERGRLLVVDLKTGGIKPKAAEVDTHAQLAAYQVAVEAGAFVPGDQDEPAGELPGPAVPGQVSGGARLVQLGATGPVAQNQSPLEDADDPGWARRMILDAGSGMGAARFEARDQDRRCRRCPARFSCPLQPEGRER